MKGFLAAAAIAAQLALPAAAMPNNVLARAACNHDLCLRGLSRTTAAATDCSSFMTTTVTPCTSTVTATATVTSTSTVSGSYPMKREAIAEPVQVEARQAPTTAAACAAITSTPTRLPAYAVSSCTAISASAPTARFSSACACYGVTSAKTTLPTQTTTVTSTSTVTAVVTSTPQLFILQSSGDQSLYITIDDTGAVRLTHDTTAANPFYVDSNNQWRNWRDPSKLFVDYYRPTQGTADDYVYSDDPSSANYPITCYYNGHNAGDFWGDCQSSGPADGNPVVYGFGTCPNEGYYLYMIPNDSNVHCYDGGYAFIGFFLVNYTGS